VTGAQARVRVTGNTRTGGSVIDFIGCALEARLRSLDPPYVVVIDPAGRCRLTILYQRYRTDRPRTLEELLCIVKALRDGGTSRSTVDDRTGAQKTKALRNSGRD